MCIRDSNYGPMHFLITAGPTREPIDPVRYLSNRSSGKMGYALAAAALEEGHEVTLVSGPVAIPAPVGVTLVAVETAQDMYDAVEREIKTATAAIFCAAVADYRVATVASEKIKKSKDSFTLTLLPNPDIFGSARSIFGFKGVLVGFAAETEKVATHAIAKLQRKQCDLLVANDVSRTDIAFDRDVNEVTLFYKDGSSEELPLRSKQELAREIIARIEAIRS